MKWLLTETLRNCSDDAIRISFNTMGVAQGKSPDVEHENINKLLAQRRVPSGTQFQCRICARLWSRGCRFAGMTSECASNRLEWSLPVFRRNISDGPRSFRCRSYNVPRLDLRFYLCERCRIVPHFLDDVPDVVIFRRVIQQIERLDL